jgi:hypothetical protein
VARVPAIFGILLASLAIAQTPPAEILSRVAEEAEVFQDNAPKALTQETLEQRAVMPSGPPRFHPRVGGKAAPPSDPGKPRMQIREIVSEYSVAPLKDSPSHNLVEFRQVVSVDGRTLQSAEKARHALSLGVHSADDRLRKRMIEDFARHGLVDIATDYGLILLAFTKRGQAQMKIAPAGESRIGPDDAIVLRWQQTSAAAGELEFHGKQVERLALEGNLYVRKSDGLPLRVEAWAQHVDVMNHRIRDEAAVDYVQSTHGFLTPVSVLHRHRVDNQLITENLYRYEPFKLFAADTEIKFTEVPDPSTLPPPPPTKK